MAAKTVSANNPEYDSINIQTAKKTVRTLQTIDTRNGNVAAQTADTFICWTCMIEKRQSLIFGQGELGESMSNFDNYQYPEMEMYLLWR